MADRDSQRYYWLKLDKDFFNEYKIRSLMSRKNGDTYITILLQLMNECLNYDGVLRYSEKRAYRVEELACVINRPPKTLEEALKVLEEMELISIDEDGTIRMDVNVGYETGKAIRMREYRSKKAQMSENVADDEAQIVLQTSLDNRDKSIENRKEEDLIKEATARMLEMGYSADLCDKALRLLYKDGYPHTYQFYQEILNTLTNDEIYNKEGYIYQIARNEAKA